MVLEAIVALVWLFCFQDDRHHLPLHAAWSNHNFIDITGGCIKRTIDSRLWGFPDTLRSSLSSGSVSANLIMAVTKSLELVNYCHHPIDKYSCGNEVTSKTKPLSFFTRSLVHPQLYRHYWPWCLPLVLEVTKRKPHYLSMRAV